MLNRIMLSLTKNSLTPEDCKKIISRVENFVRFFESWHLSDNGHGYKNTKRMFVGHYIRDILNKRDIPYTPSVELLKYDAGSSAKVHVDVSGPYRESFFKTTDAMWNQTGIIILNDEFEGGNLFFPELNQRYGKDDAGDLIIFSARNSKYAHGVSTVTSGTRYSLVLRFC